MTMFRALPSQLLLLSILLILGACASSSDETFDIVEATILEMQEAMEDGRVTSRDLVEAYLLRIAVYEDQVNAVITVNKNALEEADRLDRERVDGQTRGPLHGIPVALKDNVHTSDIRTTGGAIAFENLMPPYDATLTANLREAGAIILAKTVMTELANFTAAGMPGNYSAVGGYGMNPYDPRRDPRCNPYHGRPRHCRAHDAHRDRRGNHDGCAGRNRTGSK
jgi:amidase